jgi:WD40 repeat protein
MQVQHAEPVSPARLQPHTPRDLSTICLKCLQKEPRHRYASAAALADDLRRFLCHEPIRARPASAAERVVKWGRRRPAIAGLLAGLFVVTVLGFACILALWQRAESGWTAALDAQARAERQEGLARAAQTKAEARLHFNRLALAQHELEAFRVGQAADILGSCLTGKDEWEWRYLHHQCHRALLHLTGAAWPIQGLAFSPDGRYVAAACGQWNGTKPGEVLVWDLRGGAESHRQPLRDDGHAGPVYAVAFHPDGKRLASAGKGGTIRLWEWAARSQGKPVVQELPCQGRRVPALAFSPCGKWLAAGCDDGAVRLWDTITGLPRHTLPPRKDAVIVENVPSDGRDAVHAVTFSSDGQYLASGSRDGKARVWRMDRLGTTVEPLRILPCADHVRSLAIHPHGRWLVAGTWGGAILRFDLLQPEREAITWQMRGGAVLDLAFTRDGTALAWCGGEGPVEINSFPGGQKRMAFRGHDGPVRRLAFSPDSTRLATAGAFDRTVRIWDAAAKPELRRLPRSGSPLFVGMAFSPEGTHLALAGGVNRAFHQPAKGTVRLLDLRNETDVSFEPARATYFTSVAFHPAGKELCGGGENHTATLWDIATRRILHTLGGHTGRVNDVAYHKDGNVLATASDDGTIRLWNTASGKMVRTLTGHGAAVTSLAFDPSGNFLASTSADRTVMVWEMRHEADGPVRTLRGHAAAVQSVVWSPDGHYLASASSDQVLKVWKAGTDEETDRSARHLLFGGDQGDLAQGPPARLRYPPRLAFCPRGLRLASVSGNRPPQLWAVPAVQKALALPGPGLDYLCLAFDPAGRRLAAAAGAELMIWDSGGP